MVSFIKLYVQMYVQNNELGKLWNRAVCTNVHTILGAIYIIGNRVYVNCMCNREIDDITLNSWFYQLYHKCDISFPLCSFSFLQKKNLPFLQRGQKIWILLSET